MDPQKINSNESIEENSKALMNAADFTLEQIINSISFCPL